MFFCGLVATWRRLQAAWQAQPVLVRVTLAVEHGVVPVLCAVQTLQNKNVWYDSLWERLLGYLGLVWLFPLMAYGGWLLAVLVGLQLACVLWCAITRRSFWWPLLYLLLSWPARFVFFIWCILNSNLD
jgi:hypothetical protein